MKSDHQRKPQALRLDQKGPHCPYQWMIHSQIPKQARVITFATTYRAIKWRLLDSNRMMCEIYWCYIMKVM